MSNQEKLTFSPVQFKLLFAGAVSSGVVIDLSIALLVISGGAA